MKLKKGVLKVTIGILLIGILGYYYLRNSWENFITEKELTEFVTKVKIAGELPEKFYQMYEEEHPNVLTNSLNQQIRTGLFSNNFTKSPSLLAAMISDKSRRDNDSTRISNRKAYTLAWKLEEEATQKECLNWVLENYKFDLYIHGVHELANFYFKKSVAELNDRELSDIIALMKKPSIVNVPDRSNEDLH
ncbi:transglycosylase domain-containing protein [Arenibacter sp. F20364]|uniref:transglycosylase domain-containing protein n=1 Tax=Arenibacter sp. F20364 TaxID=2926415 RepID=UPI001FF666E0|nr:transglycosylase domain-containing protein [Arenibacter sp. F20364]MCK0188943.1 transglycosylase domain-containing protein [Arenibacter sp. F20364]